MASALYVPDPDREFFVTINLILELSPDPCRLKTCRDVSVIPPASKDFGEVGTLPFLSGS